MEDVALVRWPGEKGRRDDLADAGAPRLLLVEASEPAPVPADDLEDWIRVPAPEADVRVRIEVLARRAREHAALVPRIGGDDRVVRYAGDAVALPPVELRLAEALVDRFGAVVSREALGKAGWEGGPPGRNALDVHIMRLRRRLADVGLRVRTVRSRGYVLEPDRETTTAAAT